MLLKGRSYSLPYRPGRSIGPGKPAVARVALSQELQACKEATKFSGSLRRRAKSERNLSCRIVLLAPLSSLRLGEAEDRLDAVLRGLLRGLEALLL